MALSLAVVLAGLLGSLRAQTPLPIQFQQVPVTMGSPLPSNNVTFINVAQAGGRQPAEMTNQKIEYQKQSPIQRVNFDTRSDDDFGFRVNLDLPGPARLFERRSEREFQKGIEQEFDRHSGGTRVIFPEKAKLTSEPFRPRYFEGSTRLVTPFNVCHGRIYFEQPNFDRHGWEIGYLQPFISTGITIYDGLLLPYHSWTDPCECFECSAGKCLPGDRVPLFYYPEKFGATGLIGQVLFVGGGFFIFP